MAGQPDQTTPLVDTSVNVAELRKAACGYLNAMYNTVVAPNHTGVPSELNLLKNVNSKTGEDTWNPNSPPSFFVKLLYKEFPSISAAGDWSFAYTTNISNNFYTTITPNDVFKTAVSDLNSNNVRAFDIICTKSPSAASTLVNMLDDLRVSYQLLNDGVFNAWKAGKGSIPASYNITRYIGTSDSDSDKKRQVFLKPANDNNYPIAIYCRQLNPLTTNVFVLRRLVLGAYLTANFRLAMALYNAVTGDADKTMYANLAEVFRKKLRELNMNFTDQVSRLVEILRGNVASYSSTMNATADRYSTVRDWQGRVLDDVKAAAVRESQYFSARRLRMSSLVIAGVLAAVLAWLWVVRPPGAMLVGAGAFGVAALAGLLLIMLRVRTGIEGFGTTDDDAAKHFTGYSDTSTFSGLPNGMRLANTLKSATDADTIQTYNNASIVDEYQKFLKYSLDYALILSSSQTYRAAQATADVEHRRIAEAGNAASLAYRKAQLMGGSALTQAHGEVAGLYLGIALALIATLTGTLALLAGDNSIATTATLAFGGFAAVVAVAIYVAAASARTRTDGRKFYWGKPDPSRFMVQQ